MDPEKDRRYSKHTRSLFLAQDGCSSDEKGSRNERLPCLLKDARVETSLVLCFSACSPYIPSSCGSWKEVWEEESHRPLHLKGSQKSRSFNLVGQQTRPLSPLAPGFSWQHGPHSENLTQTDQMVFLILQVIVWVFCKLLSCDCDRNM